MKDLIEKYDLEVVSVEKVFSDYDRAILSEFNKKYDLDLKETQKGGRELLFNASSKQAICQIECSHLDDKGCYLTDFNRWAVNSAYAEIAGIPYYHIAWHYEKGILYAHLFDMKAAKSYVDWRWHEKKLLGSLDISNAVTKFVLSI